jgi:hypothetical protein
VSGFRYVLIRSWMYSLHVIRYNSSLARLKYAGVIHLPVRVRVHCRAKLSWSLLTLATVL